MEKKFEYVYTETVEHRITPEQVYGDTTAKAIREKLGGRLVEFRPPVEGEEFVPITSQVSIDRCIGAYVTLLKNTPRFILRPEPKLLREYVVKVWDEPPKAGERYMDNEDYRLNHFCVCDRSPQSPTKEDGYFIGDKRVTVEEVTK